MKKFIVAATAALFCASALTLGARQVRILREVVYQTDIHCAKCEKKVIENVSFEKGVEDLSTSLEAKTVSIVYDAAKTDTLKLARSIRSLGYTAKVISDTEKSKK